jgi:hypothetical protein
MFNRQNMYSIKNIVLIISLVGSMLAYMLFELRIIKICDFFCEPSFGNYHRTFIFFHFLLFFSLATYKLPERIFTSWWQLARIGAPVVLALSFLINIELHHSPAGEFQNMFDAPALWFLYILFSIGSIISIFVGWRKGSDSK